MNTIKLKALLILTIIGLMISPQVSAQFGKANYEKTSIERASVEFDCAANEITVLRKATYKGGGLIVLDVCGNPTFYECMGTVCQLRCEYKEKSSDYSGEGETDGKFHDLVFERASVEFKVSQEEIKQIKHFDGRGQGSYYLYINGYEVVYQCAGSVCNLKCD